MSQEIVFTSAKRGLRPGSTGFCTVRSTAGMPQNLSSLLEQLTGYSHAFDAYDRSQVDKHPVNFAHYISRVGGQRVHVLGRVSNAPLDHTNRSNKLAHLLAIDDSEINLSATKGPAGVMRDLLDADGKQPDETGFWMTEWPSDREPCVLPDSKRFILPSAKDKPGPCHAWKKIVGDPRWAAVLAESANDRKRKSFPVVFSAAQSGQLLLLVEEALSLLEPHKRWDVTFSTFFSGSLPTKVECRWQFLLDSTELGQKALRTRQRNPVIDLTTRGTPAEPASDLFTYVEKKERPWTSSRVSLSSPAPSSREDRRQKELDVFFKEAELPEDGHEADGTYELEGGEKYRRAIPPRLDGKSRRGKELPVKEIRVAVIAVVALVAFVLWGLPLIQSFSGTAPDSTLTVVPAGQTERQKIQEKVKRRRQEDQDRKDQEAAEQAAREREIAEQKRQAELARRARHATTDNTVAQTSVDSKPPPEHDDPLPEAKPFDAIRDNLERNLRIPTPDEVGTEWTRLADIHVDSPTDVTELKILGAAAWLQAGYEMVVETPKDSDSPPQREWLVQIAPPEGSLSPVDKVGTFRLTGRELFFKWAFRSSNTLLVDTELKLAGQNRLGNDSVLCRLRTPEYRELLHLTESSGVEIKLLDNSRVGKTDGLKLNYRVDGLSGAYQGKMRGTLKIRQPEKPKEPVKITHVHADNGIDYHLPELELLLIKNSQGHLVLQVEQFLMVPWWVEKENRVRIDRELLIPKVLDDYPIDLKKLGIAVTKALPKALAALKSAEGAVSSASKALKDAKPDKKPDAERRLQAAKDNLEKTRNGPVFRARDFHKMAGRWYELVMRARETMLRDVRIHYELLRETDDSDRTQRPDAAPVPIVATRDEGAP